MLVLMVDVFQKGSRTGPSWRGLGWFTLVGLVLAAAANWWLGGLSEANLAGSIALDSFRIFSNFIFLASGAFFVLIADRYLDEERMLLGEIYEIGRASWRER